jgi:hypothetical protein
VTSRAPISWPQPPEPGQHAPGPSGTRWVIAGVVGAGVTYLAGVGATLVLDSNVGAGVGLVVGTLAAGYVVRARSVSHWAGAFLAVFAAGLAIGTATLLLLIAIGFVAGLSRSS